MSDNTSATDKNTARDAETTAAASGAPTHYGESRGARTGTVVWGLIIMGIAALAFTATQWDLSVYHPAVITAWTVVGIGVLAIVGGLLAAIFRRR